VTASTGQQRARPVPVAAGAALYALAAFGAHLSYAPLLTLLLPRRILAIVPGHAAATTSLVMLAGAVTASLAHIAAGRISDRWRAQHGNRRAPVALGLGLTVVALAALGFARTTGTVVVGLIVIQAALNLMFAPLGALLVDHFPDRAKGRMAALINLAMPLAGLGTGMAALGFPHDSPAPFCAVAAVVGASVLPLVVIWPFAPAQVADPPATPVARPRAITRTGRDLVLVALARTLMQCGAAFMATYFYLFMVRHLWRAGLVPGQSVDALYGWMVLGTTLVSVMVTVMAGHWSDRYRRRRAPMILGALAGAVALIMLLVGNGWVLLAGYGLFHVALIAYLALDTALVAQILDRAARPGEVLGYMNLANTLPSIAVPSLVLALSGGTAEALWPTGFGATAVCCVLAAVLVARIRAVV
jgi:MFS family permease